MTTPSFLVDTDWLIDHFNGISAVSRRMEQIDRGGLAVSVISLAELWDGVLHSTQQVQDERQLRAFLTGVTTLGVTLNATERFGQLRGDLRKIGRLIPDFDLMIAITAIEHNITLLSNNRKHFAHIPGLILESI